MTNTSKPLLTYSKLLAKTHNQAKLDSKNSKNFKANYSVNRSRQKIVLDSGATFSCIKGYGSGKCDDGHKFLKAMFCGKEYCSECGCNGSCTHQRRIGRWFPKVMQLNKLGYLVITIPEDNRDYFLNNVKLFSAFRTSIKRKLQSIGYNKGLMRFHWFGDCKKCDGKGCDFCKQTGAGVKFHPHLNIFIDEGRLEPKRWTEVIDVLKTFVENYFKRIFNSTIIANVNYSFATDEAHKVHKLKYVTRSTFRIYNEKVAIALKGFKTTSTWGVWEKPKHETTNDAVVALEQNCCPDCAKEKRSSFIKWDVGYWHCGLCEKNYTSVEKKLMCIDTGGTCNCAGGGELRYKRTLLPAGYAPCIGKMIHIDAGYYKLINIETE